MESDGKMKYFLGADLGGTKTRVMISDACGELVGFGESGPGNHESVGYEGFKTNLLKAANIAFEQAHLTPQQVSGAGFGIAGYDWPIEFEPTMEIISTIGLTCPVELVNDTELGVYCGSPQGWGIAVVSGTGCNCRGWDESRTHFGRVTGGGLEFGEFGGASEMMFIAMRAIAYEWTGRGPATMISTAILNKYQIKDLHDLLQALICHQFEIDASDVLLVFEAAAKGDAVAIDLVRWTGRELGEMANTVIRQLHFENITFDLVQIGSMFDGSPLLTEEMKNTVHAVAPGANFIRSKAPPVMGAVILGMHAAGIKPDAVIRARLSASITDRHSENNGQNNEETDR